ncbi:MAG: metal-dependent phosphohydrolase, partial [Planktothrix sp.]
MINATAILIDVFVQQLQGGYRRTYGGFKPDYPEIISWAGTMALENIANCDALYHNVEHTMLVTLVGQEILRGKHIREGGVTPQDWLHFIISLLCHDIGYVKGVCRQDQESV